MPPAGPLARPRLFVDCTETLRLGAATGIQRVVRSIVGAAGAAEQGVECVPVRYDGRRFVRLEPLLRAILAEERTSAAPGRRWVKQALLRGSRHGVLRASLLHSGVQGVARQAVSRAYWTGRRLRAVAPAGAIADYRAGDALLLLDSNWGPDLRAELAHARRNGAQVCVVVYDLIQVEHPELVSPGAGAIYRRWFDRVMPLADRILTISRTVRDDVQRHLDTRGMARGVPVSSFRLGSDIGMPTADGAPSPTAQALFAAGHLPTCLAVGTLEPRKAQDIVLDAFEALWRERCDVRLILVGREGFGSHALVRRLERHAEAGRRLHWLQHANDADLDLCYRRCALLINASTSEGFGLPIVEALHHGMRVLASDIPVFREVGGGDIGYFPPRDAIALAGAVRQALAGPAMRTRMPQAGSVSWEVSAREVVAAIFHGNA